MAAAMGAKMLILDLSDEFGDTSLLVLDNAQEESLVRRLGLGNVCLMRVYGFTIVAHGIRGNIFVSIYSILNAKMLSNGALTRNFGAGPCMGILDSPCGIISRIILRWKPPRKGPAPR
jgi:hypothetical protein